MNLTIHSVVLIFVMFCCVQGVIFGMNFNDDLSQLVSVSDDRSVRIWDIPADWKMKR